MSATIYRPGDEALALGASPALVAMLEQIGWAIRAFDIDTAAGRFALELHRSDGRWLHVSTDRLGRASMDRFQRETSMSCGNDGRRGAPRDVVRDRFIGRTRCADPQALLLAMADYLAANPAPGREALPAGTARAAMGLLMGAPVENSAHQSVKRC